MCDQEICRYANLTRSLQLRGPWAIQRIDLRNCDVLETAINKISRARTTHEHCAHSENKAMAYYLINMHWRCDSAFAWYVWKNVLVRFLLWVSMISYRRFRDRGTVHSDGKMLAHFLAAAGVVTRVSCVATEIHLSPTLCQTSVQLYVPLVSVPA